MRRDRMGALLGGLGVLGFSLTLPATRVAVVDLGALPVTLLRLDIAAVLAVIALLVVRPPLPRRADLPDLLGVAGGVVFGYPLLAAVAMQDLPAAHGSVVAGLLPLMTALMAVPINRERPSPLFWASAAAGSALVLAFALRDGGGSLQAGDAALQAAAMAGGIGYACGARLTRRLGGWQTISWGLVVATPVLLVATPLAVPATALQAPPTVLGSLVYLGAVSQFLAFFAWYRGLEMGGTARVAQIMLLMPFLSIAAAGLLLGEHIDAATPLFAAAVAVTVVAGRRAPVAQAR
ncbi:DMT family transporter [Caenispirillum bisanense]|uniref:DMT family transporter n=1 Tax=Caenispirillum bisanense TaxID=414052 RepID=UPI0031D79701